jgi:hypothetical protein
VLEHATPRAELERRELGESFARRTGRTFLPDLPARFRGVIVESPAGAAYLPIIDRQHVVLVPATAETRAIPLMSTVDVMRDAYGRFFVLRPLDINRGPGRGPGRGL